MPDPPAREVVDDARDPIDEAPPGVSVIIIAKDEEHVIAGCLASVAWADEVIVLDSGSADRTVEIARSFTDRVYETDWPGFGPQKNRALAHATQDWVLSLDADECVSPELAAEIRRILPRTPVDGFEIPFRSTFLGREMRHGDWGNESHLRLFRRTAGRFTDDPVHERLGVDGQIGHLENPILHASYEDLGEVLEKMNRYSSAGALRLRARGKRSSVLRAVGHAVWTFLWGYVGRAGFLDGREGFVLAVSNANERFYRYLKTVYLSEADDDDT